MGYERSPRTPPQILREWSHFVQMTRLSENLHVTKNAPGMFSCGGHFSKWPPFKTTFAHISVSKTRRCMILVTIPMFSGSRNPLRTMPTTLDDLIMAAMLKFQNGRHSKPLLPISRSLKLIDA